MKHAAVLFLAVALALPCPAQILSDSLKKKGGGGNSVWIPTDEQIAARKAANQERMRIALIPTNMTSRMIWIYPAKVFERKKDTDGSTILLMLYINKTETGTQEGVYYVAGHPEAENIAVNETAPCIIVPGPVRDDLGGERLYYFFDKKEVSDTSLNAFQLKYPGVPVD